MPPMMNRDFGIAGPRTSDFSPDGGRVQLGVPTNLKSATHQGSDDQRNITRNAEACPGQ